MGETGPRRRTRPSSVGVPSRLGRPGPPAGKPPTRQQRRTLPLQLICAYSTEWICEQVSQRRMGAIVPGCVSFTIMDPAPSQMSLARRCWPSSHFACSVPSPSPPANVCGCDGRLCICGRLFSSLSWTCVPRAPCRAQSPAICRAARAGPASIQGRARGPLFVGHLPPRLLFWCGEFHRQTCSVCCGP